MPTKPKPGDHVTWSSRQGPIEGVVVKEQTTPTKIKTHKVAASRDNPQIIVRSDKTGAAAAHKASALKKAH
ncbi:MAG: DUF2945 domain-containing protein [Rubritepida sp.]|nr:DUF2945 domain-containing protein [Rubritepida sp.]